MKIIATDNLNRETVSDRVVAENVSDKDYAKVIADALNDKFCTSDNSPWFFTIRDDDFKPYTFES